MGQHGSSQSKYDILPLWVVHIIIRIYNFKKNIYDKNNNCRR